MLDPSAGLSETFRQMSDEELIERWCGGCLTEFAIDAAQTEFLRRGVLAPEYVAKDMADTIGEVLDPSELVEIARSQEISELQMLSARLDSEGIPSLIVNENTNRMGPQFSNAAGGARLLVLAQYAPDAREIVALVKAGIFALRDDEDLG